MNKLAIVTYSKKVADIHYDVLHRLLKDKVDIKKYSVEDRSISGGIDADLVIISTNDIYTLVKKFTMANIQIAIANLTLLRNGFQKVLELRAGTKALLVHTNVRQALQCIELIQQLGARHVEMIPYSPYLEKVNDVEFAITPGVEHNVPSPMRRIINIGNRVIDLSSIGYILLYFELEELFDTSEIRTYSKETMLLNSSPVIYSPENTFGLREIAAEHNQRGIVSFSPNGTIFHLNYVAEGILGCQSDAVVGKSILDLFPQPSIREAIKRIKPLQRKQVKINKIDLIIKIVMSSNDATEACYMTVERVYEESAIRLPNPREQVVARGYIAKYYLKDIITNSASMRKLKTICEMNAVTDSAILLTGETGTGKELFAQAIHNASMRKDGPFVAVNCAAVPESLLESELFGYEDGAFTGARRGGKIGLFEQAHSGTLFFDEIGEMPVHLQARLLRVLQEKEVTRIGGDRVISVDVRIISATNRMLTDLIESSQFRKDLYYRLSVIPLKIPPLRERREDIALLISVFMRQLKAEFQITASAMERLQQHHWEGNIRELRNYVEYFRNLRKSTIVLEDLPFLSENEQFNICLNEVEIEIVRELRESEGYRLPKIVFILETLKYMKDTHQRSGRRSLAELSIHGHGKISEVEIRNLLTILEGYQMVQILKGRGGTVITEVGLRILQVLKADKQVATGNQFI